MDYITYLNKTFYVIILQKMPHKSIIIIFNKLRSSKFKVSFFCLMLFFMTSNSSKGASPVKISYTVTFPEAQAHYVDIEMHIDNIQQKELTLKMPVWTPGSYLVREFAKNVEI